MSIAFFSLGVKYLSKIFGPKGQSFAELVKAVLTASLKTVLALNGQRGEEFEVDAACSDSSGWGGCADAERVLEL